MAYEARQEFVDDINRGRLHAGEGKRPSADLINSAHGTAAAAYMTAYSSSLKSHLKGGTLTSLNMIASEPDLLSLIERAAKRRLSEGINMRKKHKGGEKK